MDITMGFILGVFAFRLGMLVAGVLFCWFGYRLFAQTNPLGRAEISVKDAFTLNLHHVGPGVFFSLFGAAILIYNIHEAPTLNTAQSFNVAVPTIPTSATTKSIVIAGSVPDTHVLNDRAQLIEATAQIAFINRLAESGTVSASDQNDLSRISREIKLSLMRPLWTSSWGDYIEFESWARDPNVGSPNVDARRIFERH